ncbi:hypothetical protein NGM37_13965, partial [Streptomyces sp. TRM76130]|nr:hypothetical protein [Streptomyces sp. TRM76130]
DIGTAYECSVDGQLTNWVKTGRSTPVQQRQAGVVDLASAARYQLGTAALPNADGEYVQPTESAMLKAVSQMPDSEVAGVKTSDPTRMKDGAYPLTAVVYAAATLDQAEDARQDYARVIRYAVGDGQTQGTASGELPAG